MKYEEEAFSLINILRAGSGDVLQKSHVAV